MTSKIPGLLPPMPKGESDGKIEKLDKKSKPELLELIERQNKLMSNKAFLNLLPDKGLKIRTLVAKLNHELALRDQLERSCNLLSKLSLASEQLDKGAVANLEWPKEQNENNNNENEILDSDDCSEPEDALLIIAQNTNVKKKIIVAKKGTRLVTEADIKEVKTFCGNKNNSDFSLPEYLENFLDKTVNKAKPVNNFKPYKTTISNSHDPSKEKLRKKGKHWEVTAATPEPSIHGLVKEISLKESLMLLVEQNKHLKEVQAKHAAEKLAAQLGKRTGDVSHLPSSIASSNNYRNAIELNSDDSDDAQSDKEEGSDKEVFDDEPHDGGVVFTITN